MGFYFLHCRKVQSCCYLSCQEFHPSSNNCFHLQVFQDERPDRINKTDWLILIVEPIKFCRGRTEGEMAGRVSSKQGKKRNDEVLHLRRKWQENAGFFNLKSKNLLELIFEPGVCIREQKNENDIFSNYWNLICEILRRVLNDLQEHNQLPSDYPVL